jgi:hypothetical protein
MTALSGKAETNEGVATMKLSALIIAAVALLAFGAAQAFAHTTHGQSTKVVTVAMHDPGCHWFLAGGKFVRTLTVKGPVALGNYDEAALKVVGPTGVKHEAVGKRILLGHGTYKITMVGQAPDDNTLKLVVT